MTTARLQKLDWSFIGTGVYRAAMVAAFCALFYLRTLFATHEEVVDAVRPFQSTPARLTALEKVAEDRGQVLKDLSEWRTKKDEIDTRLIVLVENQQRLIERQQVLMDRQQTQLDEINRRTR